MCYVFHNRMQPPVLNEGSQLILEIFDLLPRESRYGGSCTNTLPQRLMAALAVFDLGPKIEMVPLLLKPPFMRFGGRLIADLMDGRDPGIPVPPPQGVV